MRIPKGEEDRISMTVSIQLGLRALTGTQAVMWGLAVGRTESARAVLRSVRICKSWAWTAGFMGLS